jgi:hypothetical protein
MSKSSKKCRVYKDGNSWCCVGPKFKNIQESASGFGDTPEEAYNDYLADIIAMKAAKKLAKAAKKLKSAVSKKETAVSKKFVAILETQVKVFFISGLTPKKVLEKSLKFNLTMECPLGNALVKVIVSELSEGPWLETLPTKTKKKSDKGSRNTRIHKCIVKAFKKGANRAGVINLALIKNGKFNTPLCQAEVTNLVRIEWERLNPPSK